MQYIQQKMIECETCKRKTLHVRNATKPNYLLHLILIIITAGLWIIPFLIILFGGINITSEPFTCTICGTQYRSNLEKLIILLWKKFFIVLFVFFLYLTGFSIITTLFSSIQNQSTLLSVVFFAVFFVYTIGFLYGIYKYIRRKKIKGVNKNNH